MDLWILLRETSDFLHFVFIFRQGGVHSAGSFKGSTQKAGNRKDNPHR